MKPRVRKSAALMASLRGKRAANRPLELSLLDRGSRRSDVDGAELGKILQENISKQKGLDDRMMFEQLLKEVASLRRLRDAANLKNGTCLQVYAYWYDHLAINWCFDVSIFVYFIFKCVEAQVGETDLTDTIEFGFGVLFCVDILLHVIAIGFYEFFKSITNWFDLFVVAITIFSWLDIIHDHNLMLLRTFRLFQTIMQFEDFQILYFAINKSLVQSFALFVGLILLMSMYSVFGVAFFGPDMYEHFGTFSRGIYTMLQVLTGDAWSSNIGRVALEVNPIVAALFFTSYVVFIGIIIMNVVQAVFLDSYLQAHEDVQKQQEEDNMYELFALFDKDGSGSISMSELNEMCEILTAAGYENYNAERISSWIDQENGNSDGVITFPEFLQGKRNKDHMDAVTLLTLDRKLGMIENNFALLKESTDNMRIEFQSMKHQVEAQAAMLQLVLDRLPSEKRHPIPLAGDLTSIGSPNETHGTRKHGERFHE